jgi:8-oxo-dGTP diphosphatase
MAWTEPSLYWASMPAFHGAADALISAPGGKVLLVKPYYVSHWDFPGGLMDEGETPQQAAVREVKEETGLTVVADTLLVLDWIAPDGGPRSRSMAHFLFDGGSVPDLGDVVRQEDEIDEVALFDVEEAAGRMSARGGPRLLAALRARESGRTALGTKP